MPYLEAKVIRRLKAPEKRNNGRFVNSDTTVILVDGENSGEVFTTHCAGILGSTFKVLHILNSIYKDYILTIIRNYQKLLREKKKGSAIPHLNKSLFFNLLIGIPPLAEQKRIVAKIEELLPYIDEYGKCEGELTKLNKDFPDALKKSILQSAVQGKLVPQDPNDESAEKLLEKIRAERQKLIKEGKIKKSKTESHIFRRGSAYYEKCGSEEKCIDSELPFEIPDSWRWVRLGNITHINPRNLIDDNLEVSFIPMNFIEDGYSNKHSYSVRKWKEIKNGFTHFCDGDIGIAKITPCFENRKSVIFKDLKNKHGAGTTELHIIRSLSAMLYSKYLLYFFKSEFFISNGIKSYTGTAGQQRISKEFVSKYLFPFPPLEEQKRIVAKIEELLAIIDSMKK